MRIVLDDAKMDAAAGRLNSVGAALSGVQGRISPSLSAGAPPAIKGQVDAAIADARNLVAGVAAHCPARARELRRRAILARLAAGDFRVADLRQLRAWDAERPFINARVGNGKVDDGGGLFGGLKAFADGVKDAGSDVVGAIGKHGPEVGHTTLDILGLVPGLGEPVDGVNALIYAAEGDEVNAGLSAAAMIPFLGWGATGGKIGGKIKHMADAGGGGGTAGGKGAKGAGKGADKKPRAPRAPRLTAAQQRAAAKALGFTETGRVTKHGEPVFRKGRQYISHDATSHNVGGGWKMAKSVEGLDSKTTRMGTYDADLNRIGD